jgi:hypothetical protein
MIAAPMRPHDRLGHRDVGHEAGAEEALPPGDGPVDELIGDDEGARREVLPQRADRGERDHVGDPGPLQRVDVRGVVDLIGGNPVAAPVPRQEGQSHAVQLADEQIIDGLPNGPTIFSQRGRTSHSMS